MIDLADVRPARLYTTWGTVLYVEAETGQLRHGPIDTSPENTHFVANRQDANSRRSGWLVHDNGARDERIACGELTCRVVAAAGAGGSPPAAPTLLELVPLGHRLAGFTAGDQFLSAYPDGLVTLSRSLLSTWECFLASENWCGAAAFGGRDADTAPNGVIDWERIKRFMVDWPAGEKTADTQPGIIVRSTN
jgi:hypothetical protein